MTKSSIVMEPVNRKKAPQQEIVEINRVGSWGRVTYQHKLSCGHVEIRKRPSSAPRIACTWCVQAERKDEELRALAIREPESLEIPDDDIRPAGLETAEGEAVAIKAAIVRALGCGAEAVDVVLEDNDGTLEVSGAIVFLDAIQARSYL